MIISIAAVAENGVIGNAGRLVWRNPEDIERYKRITLGKTIIMGRKTWESIPEKFRPLPGRRNVVITRDPHYPVPEGVERFSSLDDALAAHATEDIIINGGAEIYRAAMPAVDRLEITHIHQSFDGDTSFPQIDPAIWNETAREDRDGFSFVTYERIR
jgi:dihydrofolate reductase